ncbi:hypothetical protein Taro_056693 [Colocasia esculenta]|uniref:Uncharacterized protein n=1 Tax=Colocasia esculenta TaxID=4460 RepID=A0A843XY63_COLES|nr:hypothetical protein [Colocasia esculenta]
MAAALSLGRPLHGHPRRPRHKTPPARARLPLSCRSQLLSDPEEDGGEGKRGEMGKEGKGRRRALSGILAEAEKVGRGLKESLSPRRKGDWKDVLLMSLSFAVYVYISQKLVSGLRSFVRKPPADELGYAPPEIPGAGVFSPLICTKGMG